MEQWYFPLEFFKAYILYKMIFCVTDRAKFSLGKDNLYINNKFQG